MPTKSVTVAGKVFAMPLVFEAGQEVVLTEGMASQFNQVYHENLRNNIAAKVKKSIDEGTFSQDSWQAQINKIADEYEFGTRRAGGPRTPTDPIAKEALRIAVEAISNNLRAQGKKPSDFKNLKEVAAQLVERKPEITEKAKENIAALQAAAGDTLDEIMGGLEEKPAEAEAAQAAE